MTKINCPRRIRHDAGGTRAVQAPPDAAQAHARIIEALRDPFAFAVALLESEAVRMRACHGMSWSAGHSCRHRSRKL